MKLLTALRGAAVAFLTALILIAAHAIREHESSQREHQRLAAERAILEGQRDRICAATWWGFRHPVIWNMCGFGRGAEVAYLEARCPSARYPEEP